MLLFISFFFCFLFFPECDNYGSTFTVYENLAIDGYNHHRTHITLSLADCKQACIDMGNACGSVDYSDVLEECWLQTATYQQVLEADPAAFKLFGGTYSIYSRHCELF